MGVDLSPRAYPPLTRALAIGEPGSLLRRRPDVRAAERRLASVTANESVAAADLYPHISISGFLGLIAGRGGRLFDVPDSRAWAVTPALSWAAFDIGSARARLRGAEGATREYLAQFEQVVQLGSAAVGTLENDHGRCPSDERHRRERNDVAVPVLGVPVEGTPLGNAAHT